MSNLEPEFSEFTEWERELYRQALLALLQDGRTNGHYACEQAQHAVLASRGVTSYRAVRLDAALDDDA